MKYRLRVECYRFIFCGVSDAREDGDSHSEIQQQDAHLTVTVLHETHRKTLLRNLNISTNNYTGY